MKKNKILLLVAFPLLLSSCNSNEDLDFNYNTTVSCLNIITSLSDGYTEATNGSYYFVLSRTGSSYLGNISSSTFVLDNAVYNLYIPDSSFQGNAYSNWFTNVSGGVTGNNYFDLKSGNIYLTTVYFYPYSTPYQYPSEEIIGEFYLDDQYRVNTFQETTCFYGKVLISYDDNGYAQYYSNDNAVYQLHIDILQRTASIVINNAKFSDSGSDIPLEMLKLDNLNYSFSQGVITVEGTDIVPQNFVNGRFVEYKDMLFNNIQFKTVSQDLIKGEITFVSTDQDGVTYNGTFTGDYSMINFPK